jgi:hypothetical protein
MSMLYYAVSTFVSVLNILKDGKDHDTHIYVSMFYILSLYSH